MFLSPRLPELDLPVWGSTQHRHLVEPEEDIKRQNDAWLSIFNLQSLRHNHTERQEERQAAASPMQVYGDASLDAPNRPQTHSQAATQAAPCAMQWIQSAVWRSVWLCP